MKLLRRLSALLLTTALTLPTALAAGSVCTADPPPERIPAGLGAPAALLGDAVCPFPENPGCHARWIDRLALPDYALRVYDLMEEGCDGDGDRDFFIDPASYTPITGSGHRELPFGTWTSITEHYSDGSAATYTALFVACLNDPSPEEKAVFKAAVYAAQYAFLCDHPEVFWLFGAPGCMQITRRGTVYCYIPLYHSGTPADDHGWDCRYPRYRGDRTADIVRDMARREDSIRRILSPEAGYPAEGTDVQKVRYFDRWLTHHNGYSRLYFTLGNEELYRQYPMAYECLSALEGRWGDDGPVCSGYSAALKVLCDRAGIPCTMVSGLASGGLHRWNSVQVRGRWYGVDTTWNDPTENGSVSPVSGGESDRYLLVGTEGGPEGAQPFGVTHVPQNDGLYGLVFLNGPRLERESCPLLRLKFSGGNNPAYPGETSRRLTASLPVVSWISSRPETVRVAEDGSLTFLQPGLALITARAADGQTASYPLLCMDPPPEYSRILYAFRLLQVDGRLYIGLRHHNFEGVNSPLPLLAAGYSSEGQLLSLTSQDSTETQWFLSLLPEKGLDRIKLFIPDSPEHPAPLYAPLILEFSALTPA